MLLKNRLLHASLTMIACGALVMGCDSDGANNGGNGDVDNTRFQAQESFAQVVPIVDQVRFDLTMIAGEIEITGVAAATEINLSGQKRVKSESVSDAQNHLDDIDFTVLTNVNEIAVRTEQPSDSGGRQYEVDCVITLPMDMAVEIDHIAGTILLENLEGDVRVTLIAGNIDSDVQIVGAGIVSQTVTAGSIFLRVPSSTSATFSSDVTVGNISMTGLTLSDPVTSSTSMSGTLGGGEGDIDLKVTSGNITVTGYAARTVGGSW